MHFLQRHLKSVLLLLLFGIGAIVLAPFAHFQEFLSQGDHGRDLYAAQAVFRGELPYKDFWWVYGPLMPYYYGLFYKFLGAQISSIILGKLLLKICAGAFIYLAMAEIASPIAAFLTGCWFIIFHQDFFFTYNHIGGIVMVVAVAYCLLSYIRQAQISKAFATLGFIFILCLIKINFGITALVITFLTVAACDGLSRLSLTTAKKMFYATGLLVLPLIVYLIYWSLLKSLSPMEIRECLPYLGDDQPYNTSPLIALNSFIQIILNTIQTNWLNASFAIIILSSLARTVYLFAKNKFVPARKMVLLMALGMLSVYYVFNFHEYLKSGVWYRSFWSQPLSMMISFLLIDIAAQSFSKKIRWLLFAFISLLAFISWYSVLPKLHAVQTEQQHLTMPHTDIYVTNTPAWIATVQQTTDFLNKNLKSDELFFALPYDCLYYYLTNKKTPTRQLIFFQHIKIPTEQEQSIIAELEKNHVNTIVLSSRAYAHQEYGLGVLGDSYCPLLGKYIKEHFKTIAQFGDWSNEPGWAWNHGTVILKRQ